MSMHYFGSVPMGDVYEVTITNGRGMEAKILSLGAALRSLILTDENGEKRDVVLGYDLAEAYLYSSTYFGATVGRFCNRIGGAAFDLDGRRCELPANEGKNQLHGGPAGFSRQLWTPLPVSESEAIFRLFSPDGDMGFPGNVNVQVTYRLTGDSLELEYQADTDAPTVLNLTNHSYFNLSGHASGSIGKHRLQLAAEAYTPTDAGLIPTGEIRPVAGSILDLKEGKELENLLSAPELSATGGLDHNFVLSGNPDSPAAQLSAADSPLRLTLYTDQPGVQVYTAGGLGMEPGKDGAVYQAHQGICLETQGFPDAMHHENFPSVVLRPGGGWKSRTVYSFQGVSQIRRRKAKLLWV